MTREEVVSHPDAEEERVLLKRSAAGDAAAFEPIVVVYQNRAYQYALAILRNHHDALDLSQDAFVRAFRSLDRFDVQRTFLPWFLRILRNLCLNTLKKRGRRPENPGTEDAEEIMKFIPSQVAGPDVSLARQEQADRIGAALGHLSPEHREVIFLRHFEDMSYEDIAGILGIPVGTVMSRLFNGRRALARRLKSSETRE